MIWRKKKAPQEQKLPAWTICVFCNWNIGHMTVPQGREHYEECGARQKREAAERSVDRAFEARTH